ncbi:MAG: serine/threonine-protein kinase [Mariprofundaceae bacterium]
MRVKQKLTICETSSASKRLESKASTDHTPNLEAIAPSMNCPKCGSVNAAKQLFCSRCEYALSDGENAPRLGPYRLVAKIGEGGMGVVYRAIDDKLHREVAVKVLHPHLLRNKELVNRFRREARLHAQIIHPNIVTLLSVYESASHLALVVEMVHGKTLKQFLRDNRHPSLFDVLRISDGILSGLSAAHELNLVHRDLKPANVLLGKEGDVKLMDFGLAKSQSATEDITKSGATVGSFRYMAPEQILNQPVDERTDLYAFGILLYQMCTGQLPFDITGSGGEFEIMEKQVRHKPIPPQEINPNIPAALAETITSLLAKSPDNRPRDCNAVRKLLMDLTHKSKANIRPVAKPSQAEKPAVSNKEKHGLNGASQRIRSMFSSVESKRSAKDSVQPAEASLPPKDRTLRMPLLLLLAMLLGGVLYLMRQLPPTSEPQPQAIQHIQTSVKYERPARQDPPEASSAREEPVKLAKVVNPKPLEAKPAIAKAAQTKPQKAQKAKPAAAIKPIAPPPAHSVTFSNKHKMVRSDRSVAPSDQPHEFMGGKHVFFSDLEDYTWKDKLHTQKEGWIRLYLKDTAQLSKIIIRQASVDGRNFSGGEIQFEVQKPRGKWVTLLRLKDQDIGEPLTIVEPRDALREVKGIRMRFRSPEPITIGPIDLLP